LIKKEESMLTKTSIGKHKTNKSDSVPRKRVLQSRGGSTESMVGIKIKEIRTHQALTLKKLAEHSKLNINTLSMIEKGKTSPSVGTLQQLARALEVPINAFFESDSVSRKIIFTSRDKRPVTICCNAAIHNLGKDLKNNSIEPFIIKMEKNAGSGGRAIVHTGLEFAYCLTGKIQYIIEEDEYPMLPGDSIVFEAYMPHRWENIHDDESQIILVISPSDRHDEPGGRHFHAK
jgi:transcriptional regulator with XRE-family HTH domain